MTKTDSQSASRSSSSGDQPSKQRRKPGRAPVSCAECRRLKLRCDRKVPCETCVKRGCSAICPEGSLTTGNRTNRLAFADAEELQKNVDSLRSRVAELETALRKLQAEISNEPHPLLVGTPESSVTPGAPGVARPTPSSRSDPGPASQVPHEEDDFIDAFGTLTLGLRGESRFYGPTSRAEFLVHASRHDPMAAAACSKEDFPGLSEEIFEEALKGYESTCTKTELKKQALEMLPPLDEACRLCDIFLEHGSYLWQAIPRVQLYDEILSVIYRSFPYPPNADDPSLISTHAVSLLFIILGLATLFDPQAAPYSTMAKEYFLLSRLALRFVSPMQDTTLWAIQTTVYQVQFMQLSAQDPSHFVSHQSWIIMGFAVKLGNSIGLHVRSSKWQLDAEASRRRAGIFWQSFALDTWLSFHFGRPPCMSLAFIDCEFPTESESSNDVPQPERQFQPWIWQYTRLVSGVMSTAFGAKTPTYSTVIDLDRKIRDFPVPHPLRCVTGEVVSPDLSPTIRIQRYFVMASKEIIILHLHRPYFAQALCDMPHDLLKHRFGPSVMATYRSAWRLIEALQDTYRYVPFIFDRVPIPWSYAISAAIAMCLLASRAPTSPLAPASVHELWRLVAVFEQGAATSQTAAINLEVVRKMHRQAQDQTTLPETRDPSNPLCAELDRLGGKTQLIATEGYPRTPSPGSAPTTSSGPNSAVGSLPTPPPPPPTNGIPPCPSKCNPHPLLVSDLHTFEGFNIRASAASHDNTTSSMDFDFNFDLSQAFPLPLESQYGYYHAQQQTQQEYVQQLDSSLWECQPPLPDYTGYFPQDGYDSALPAMEVQGQVRPQQGSAPSVGVVQGLPAMPVLDATWQSFVEQLGF